jgi:hypothetical protein
LEILASKFEDKLEVLSFNFDHKLARHSEEWANQVVKLTEKSRGPGGGN